MKHLYGCLIITLLSGFYSAVADVPAARQWNFRVFLDEKEIGTHDFNLQTTTDAVRVTTTARFDVKVLFINVYKYAHDDQELWRNGCLVNMQSITNNDGKQLRVFTKETTAGLNISTGAKQYYLSDCVMSFAYWSPLMLQQKQLLNAQTGEYDAVDIKLLNTTTVRAAGKDWLAKRYSLTGKKLKIDLWYSLEGDGLALESTTENGRCLRYVLN
ncbi:MAG: DUF6134 family protein [Steroidobacteraceae bacterium]